MSFRFEVPVLREEFDLGLCVQSGQVFRWDCAEEETWTGLDGERWFRVRQLEDRIEVESNAGEHAFRELFSLDRDWSAVTGEILRRDPSLAPQIEAGKGLRLMRPSSPREVFFSFLCSSNNHLPRIRQMVRRLAMHGERLKVEDEGLPALHVFPSVERVAEIPEEELWAAGFGYRSRTIPKAARRICEASSGPTDGFFENLKSSGYREAHAALSALPGVGPKLADCICLYGLGYGEAVPVDTHLWQAITRHYFPEWEGKSPTAARYLAVGDLLRERFGDLAGIAHFYLFYENLRTWRKR